MISKNNFINSDIGCTRVHNTYNICAFIVEYTERFREQNGSGKCTPKVHLHVSILIYKNICAFVVEYTERFREQNGSV